MVRPVDPSQGAFDFGENPEKPQRGKVGPSDFDEELSRQKENRKEKARQSSAVEEYMKDQRQPRSDMIRQAEIEKMKEILDKKARVAQSSMVSPSGNTTAAGRGTAYGGADLEMGMKGSRMPKPKLKAGGKVKSASARADGCAIRGKTRA
jgi:hypothetical protein